MWSRREQHQAYQFLNRRIVSTMLSGEPETPELPMRRFGMALFSGIAVALLVVAGFTVYGLLFPGGGKPAENAIIVERETGATYLYLQGRLHPVLNFTSARLILGQADPAVASLSRASLRDLPRGRPVGIANAPETLPDPQALLGPPWSVCTAQRSPDSVELATHVLVGWEPPGGVALHDTAGMLVTDGTDRYLIWRDHRLLVPDNTVLAALGWAAVRPAPVAAAFLDVIPPGPDLRILTIPDAGRPAAITVDGAAVSIGQLFVAETQYFVAVADGLAPIGGLTVRLWEAAGRRATPTSAREVGRLLVHAEVEPPGLPAEIPTVSGTGDHVRMVCATYRGASDVERPVTVATSSQLADGMSLPDPTIAGGAATSAADRVAVPGGRGALAAVLTPTGSAAPGTAYVVTDQGIKYPIPGSDQDTVLESLGYGDARPIAIPGPLLDLVPTGPALDPQAAALFAGAPPAGAST